MRIRGLCLISSLHMLIRSRICTSVLILRSILTLTRMRTHVLYHRRPMAPARPPTLPRQVLARVLALRVPRPTMTRTAPLRLHTTPREKHRNQAGQGRRAAAAETGGWEVGRIHDTGQRDRGGSAKCGRVTPFSSPAPARPPPRVPCPSCTCALAPYPGLLASWHNGAPASPVEARSPSSCAPAPCQCPSVCFIPPQLSPSAVDR